MAVVRSKKCKTIVNDMVDAIHSEIDEVYSEFLKNGDSVIYEFLDLLNAVVILGIEIVDDLNDDATLRKVADQWVLNQQKRARTTQDSDFYLHILRLLFRKQQQYDRR